MEARRHRERRQDRTLFVFGDSFVDAGNLPRSAKSRASRGWYYPYGSSDSAHRNRATGRLSDGLVQSDFLGTYVRTCVYIYCCISAYQSSIDLMS